MSLLICSIPKVNFRNAAFAATAVGMLGASFTYTQWEKLPEWYFQNRPSCSASDFVAGVVFTGSDGRIQEGIRLLDEGKIQKLLISGDDFESLKLSELLTNTQHGRTLASQIVIDEHAVNTRENAQNTAKWLISEQGSHVCEIKLVTSAAHMPRSTYLLSEYLALNGLKVPIVPHPVQDSMSNWGTKITEIRKMAMTLIGIEERAQSAYLRRHEATPREPFKLIH